MNIFYLHEDIFECAKAHADKHVVKMILEYAQLLSTAHVELDGVQVAYKATHKNHPSAKWVRESRDNYAWLYGLFLALCEEYTHRYGKVHLTYQKHAESLGVAPESIPDIGFTTMPQCMPDEYKDKNAIIGYRTYYRQGKADLLKYTNRNQPKWLETIPC